LLAATLLTAWHERILVSLEEIPSVARNEQLWAPWRLAYIKGESVAPDRTARATELEFLPGSDSACFICRGVADSDDRRNLIVERSEDSLVILNRYPYNNGHLLLAPRLHKGRLDELTPHEQLDLQQLTMKYVGLIERLMKAEGFNVGLNLGRASGAGVPGHLHWHIVPRWSGDTNFMASSAGIRVLPQALDALWEMLHEAHAAGDPRPSA
jgi:ATP adenylyltransferase